MCILLFNIYVYVCICMYVYIRVYVCIYIYTHTYVSSRLCKLALNQDTPPIFKQVFSNSAFDFTSCFGGARRSTRCTNLASFQAFSEPVPTLHVCTALWTLCYVLQNSYSPKSFSPHPSHYQALGALCCFSYLPLLVTGSYG